MHTVLVLFYLISQFLTMSNYFVAIGCKVVRVNFRQLQTEEEKMDESMVSAWEMYLVQLQEAMEFINVQTLAITQRLEESFKVRKHYI